MAISCQIIKNETKILKKQEAFQKKLLLFTIRKSLNVTMGPLSETSTTAPIFQPRIIAIAVSYEIISVGFSENLDFQRDG